MKGKQRLPLWLLCDVSACLRLHIALAILAMAMRRFMPKKQNTPVSRDGVAWLTVWLGACECLLRWVIARQAFRLCGLDPRTARTFRIGEAASPSAWRARGRSLVRMYDNMTLCARRWARRIKAAMAARPSRPSAAAAAAFEILPAAARIISFCAPASAGQRIRAPPPSARDPCKPFTRALLIPQRGRGRMYAAILRSTE